MGNDALEGDEGDCDHLAFFIARHLYMHEYRTKGVECVTTILPSKTNISPCAEWLDHDVRVKTKERNVPEAILTATRLVEEDIRARDFTTAYSSFIFATRGI